MKPVALTFDDGPSRWTPLVLDLLREHEARATFFVIGARVRERPDDVRRIVAEGHELGSHTLTHPRLTEISDDEVRAEITGGLEAIEEVLAERPTLFRAPGFYAERRELAIVEELGLEAVFAHVDPQDWRPERDSHTIFRLVLDELVREHFDLRPAAILRDLDLRRPIYAKTAAYGHFGRDDHDFTWERTDKADALGTAAGISGRETATA